MDDCWHGLLVKPVTSVTCPRYGTGMCFEWAGLKCHESLFFSLQHHPGQTNQENQRNHQVGKGNKYCGVQMNLESGVEAAYRFEKWNKLNRTKSVHCNFLSGRLHGPSAPTWSTCRQETWRGIHLCKLGLYGCFARELFQVGFCSLHGASCLQRVEVLSDRNLLAATTKAMKNTETLKHAFIIRIYKGTANSRAWHWLEALCSLRDKFKAMLRHRRKGHSNCKGDVRKRFKKKEPRANTCQPWRYILHVC